MALIAEFENQEIDSNVTETNCIDLHDTRNHMGPKHLLVENNGGEDIIVRYSYADIKETIVHQKSLDSDIENLVPAGQTQHIILEGSWYVEKIKVSAILVAAGPASELKGKLLAPHYTGYTDRR